MGPGRCVWRPNPGAGDGPFMRLWLEKVSGRGSKPGGPKPRVDSAMDDCCMFGERASEASDCGEILVDPGGRDMPGGGGNELC